MERGDVTIERGSARLGQTDLNSSPSIRDTSFDGEIPDFFQGGELFGQRGIGEAEMVTDECEVHPVG